MTAKTKPGGYEAHLTFDKAFAGIVEAYANALHYWVYSQITGCPILGTGTYCYLSGYHQTNPNLLKEKMDVIVAELATMDVPCLRAKIEHIVYDTKTGVSEL